ncbi:MAG: ABC transporter ATP-binding protein [Vicinamibacterales bacterium]
MRVRFEGVSKRYGAQTALSAVDLDVQSGECLVLLGPSGCGKTTLLRLLAGLERPDDGHIWIGDRVVNDIDPAARDVAMVFQSYALYPHFTVFQNIAFPLRARGVAAGEIDRRVRAAAARVGLEALLERRPAQLSGGQQQRVALGRAVVRNPAVYLMDEPLSNLDAQLRLQTRTELKRLHQELGTTMVYVTHDQAEAMTLAGRIAILQHGSIVQLGAPLDLYRQPANTFVATFLGNPAMNLLDDTRNGRPVKAGIRPEDVQVSTTTREGFEPARVVVVEPMGNEMLVILEKPCRPGSTPASADGTERLVARTVSDLPIVANQPVWIRLPPERVLHFDAGDGTRIAD